jgi:pectinesterase
MTDEAARTNMSGLAFGTVWTTRAGDYPALVAQSPGVSPDPPAGNETLVVDGEADGDEEYATVQAALNDSADGDRVEVRPGVYAEELTLDANVTLVAPRGATLDGSSLDRPVALGIEGDASPTVGGFRVTGYRRAVLAFGTGGAWTLRNATLLDNRYGVTAGSTTGDWAVRNVTLRNASSGIGAVESTGDWTVADSAFRNVSGSFDAFAVDAGVSTGNWTVRNVTVRDATSGVGARYAEGAWTVRNTSVHDAPRAGVDALGSTGDWTLADATVETAAVGVLASASAGDWRVGRTVVRNVTVPDDGAGERLGAAAGTAVHATDTTGAWSVHDSTIADTDRAGINATGAAVEGNATRNWWGQSSGPEPGDCVGNVTCADHLTSEPDVGSGTGEDDGDDAGAVFTEPIPGTGASAPPTDPDGDGEFEDVDGSGTAGFDDAIALAFADTSGLDGEQVDALDFDGDGDVDFDDAVSLAFQV